MYAGVFVTKEICSSSPAVILERVQQASLLTALFSWFSNEKNFSNAPDFNTSFVCWSDPVMRLPKVLNVGMTIDKRFELDKQNDQRIKCK